MTTLGCAHSHVGPFAPADVEAHYPPDAPVVVLHIDLDVRVDVAAKVLDGRVELRLRGRRGATRLVLDAVDFTDVVVTGARSGYDGMRLTLDFDAPFGDGEERTVAIAWSVSDPPSGLNFSQPTEQLPEAPWFAVTDHETERARHWLPCIDHPSSRPTLSFAIRAESRFTVLANGALVDETTNEDGTKTTRYVLEHPCPSYLTCFAVGDFVRFDGEAVSSIPVAAFGPRPFTTEMLERSFGKTSAMLAWMQTKLGVPYPYPKYFQFAATGIGGAMENISLVSWDDRFVLDEALASEEAPLVDVVNVHEMAHSWFGDHVVCRDFAHSWLKESWATYLESVYLEEHLGKDEADYDRYSNVEAYFTECDERYRRPIVTRRFESSWDLFDMHLYPGGAMRIHMLRRILGDSVFWPSVTKYLERHGRGLVETDDFRRVLEEGSGRSLVRFFDQWLLSPGFPELAVTATFEAEKKLVRIVIEQKQINEKEGIPRFDFDLDVEIDDGTTRRRRTIAIDAKRVELVLDAVADPRAIVLDPDFVVIARYEFDPGIPRLLTQLREGADVRLRIDAAKRLVKSGKSSGIAAIGEASKTEPFWGVRASFAKALADSGTNDAIEVLLERVGAEPEPRALGAAFRALTHYRDPRIVEVVGARIARGLPPRALEAAHEALGYQRGGAPIDLLASAARSRGFGGFGAAGALRALGQSRSPDALEALLAAAVPGGSEWRARPAAMTGLGALAPSLEARAKERAVEALVDGLRDPDPKVRRAAAAALTSAGEPSGVDAVRRYARALTAQERIRVERGLRTASPSQAAALAKAEERIDALSKQLDALRVRLESLEAEAKKDASATTGATGARRDPA